MYKIAVTRPEGREEYYVALIGSGIDPERCDFRVCVDIESGKTFQTVAEADERKAFLQKIINTHQCDGSLKTIPYWAGGI